MKTSEDIIHACNKTEALAPKKYPEDLPSSPELDGAPQWYSFEYEAWSIGEEIRKALSVNPKLKKDSRVNERIIRVIQNRNLRRGRQSFVMAIGNKFSSPHQKQLAQFLNDTDINGHVINTLHKMHAFSFSSDVTPFLDSDITWIRNSAKKYLSKAEEK